MKKLACLLIAVALLVCSCSKEVKSDYDFKVVTKNELIDFITKTNKAVPQAGLRVMSSVTYAVPDVRWIERTYTPFFYAYLFDNDLRTPTDLDNDCVKFTAHGLSSAYNLYHRTSNRPEKTALAVGSFENWQGFGVHSFLFFIAMDNGKMVIVFYEPQTQRIIPVDPQDCYAWSM